MIVSRDLHMMQNPDLWPQLVLPLIQKKDMRLGILLPAATVVYLCNMFAIPDDLSQCPRQVYTSYEEIIADGWMVD